MPPAPPLFVPRGGGFSGFSGLARLGRGRGGVGHDEVAEAAQQRVEGPSESHVVPEVDGHGYDPGRAVLLHAVEPHGRQV